MEPQEVAPPPAPPGAPRADFPRYATLFALVFLAGFAVIALVLATRTRRRSRVHDDG